jgi:hypothetical protein
METLPANRRRDGARHSSARFALTHAGRALVLRTARLIEGRAA